MSEIAIHPAPGYMQEYLLKLTKVIGFREPVQMALIAAGDMPKRVGVTDDPHGFLRVEAGRVPLIVLADNVPESRWRSLVAHELLHLIRWTIDAWVLRRLPDAEHPDYMRLVEETMQPLTILLMVGGAIDAEWVEGE